MALTDKLTDIADAIRAKTGTSAALSLTQMAQAVQSITLGSANSRCFLKTLAADASMKVAMPLSFGTTGQVSVTNLGNTVHGSYTIATAAEPITFEGNTPLRERLVTDERGWLVNLSPDRKSLLLEYCANTILLIR